MAGELFKVMAGVNLVHVPYRGLAPALTDLIVALSRSAAGSLWLTNVIRFITAFAVLLVPSTAMGATLPLLVAALAGRRLQVPAAAAFDIANDPDARLQRIIVVRAERSASARVAWPSERTGSRGAIRAIASSASPISGPCNLK